MRLRSALVGLLSLASTSVLTSRPAAAVDCGGAQIVDLVPAGNAHPYTCFSPRPNTCVCDNTTRVRDEHRFTAPAGVTHIRVKAWSAGASFPPNFRDGDGLVGGAPPPSVVLGSGGGGAYAYVPDLEILSGEEVRFWVGENLSWGYYESATSTAVKKGVPPVSAPEDWVLDLGAGGEAGANPGSRNVQTGNGGAGGLVGENGGDTVSSGFPGGVTCTYIKGTGAAQGGPGQSGGVEPVSSSCTVQTFEPSSSQHSGQGAWYTGDGMTASGGNGLYQGGMGGRNWNAKVGAGAGGGSSFAAPRVLVRSGSGPRPGNEVDPDRSIPNPGWACNNATWRAPWGQDSPSMPNLDSPPQTAYPLHPDSCGQFTGAGWGFRPGPTRTFTDSFLAMPGRIVFEWNLPPVVKGDMNGDGKTDLVLRRNNVWEHHFWWMDGVTRIGETPMTPQTLPTDTELGVSGVDDFNADGRQDLVFWKATTGEVQFWLMNGAGGRLGQPVTLAGYASPWKLSATADFNHDGAPDLVWRNFATQKIEIRTMNGTGYEGTVVPSPDQAADANWEIVGAVDLNGDANTDFLWYNPDSGKIVYWWMDASVVRTAGNFTNPPNAGDNNWKVLAVGDYGVGGGGLPGTNDVVWRNADSGSFVVWYMDFAGNRTGGTFTSPASPSPDPTTWTIVGPR